MELARTRLFLETDLNVMATASCESTIRHLRTIASE